MVRLAAIVYSWTMALLYFIKRKFRKTSNLTLSKSTQTDFIRDNRDLEDKISYAMDVNSEIANPEARNISVPFALSGISNSGKSSNGANGESVSSNIHKDNDKDSSNTQRQPSGWINIHRTLYHNPVTTSTESSSIL